MSNELKALPELVQSIHEAQDIIIQDIESLREHVSKTATERERASRVAMILTKVLTYIVLLHLQVHWE